MMTILLWLLVILLQAPGALALVAANRAYRASQAAAASDPVPTSLPAEAVPQQPPTATGLPVGS